jgi:hypothetical protein
MPSLSDLAQEIYREEALYDRMSPEQKREHDAKKKAEDRKRKLEKLNNPVRYFFKYTILDILK